MCFCQGCGSIQSRKGADCVRVILEDLYQRGTERAEKLRVCLAQLDVMAASFYVPQPRSCCVALVDANTTLAGFTTPAVFGWILSHTEDFEAGILDVTVRLIYKSFASNRTCDTLCLIRSLRLRMCSATCSPCALVRRAARAR